MAALNDVGPLRVEHFLAIPRRLGLRGLERQALSWRLHAFCLVIAERRGELMIKLHFILSPSQQPDFDLALAATVSVEPLDDDGRFSADSFFERLNTAICSPHGVPIIARFYGDH